MARYANIIRRSFKVIDATTDEVRCICPWHRDRSGHLYVNSVTGLYLCFVCGAKGSLGTKETPPADESDVRAKLDKLRNPHQKPKFHTEAWLDQFSGNLSYWIDERKIPEEWVQKFRLGYDPFSGRATLPLRDMHGNILGVTYRRLDDGRPKYLHPNEFPIGRHLYGAWMIGENRTIALVEGQIDAIKCWSERVPAVAAMGSRLTRDQVRVLQRSGVHRVVCMFDNDSAGRKGTINVYSALRGSGIQLAVGWYRPYWLVDSENGLVPVKDPDQLSGDRLRKMHHSAVSIVDWISRTR